MPGGSTPRIILATANQGKIMELRELLKEAPLVLVTPFDLGIELEVEESGPTFEENATIKAKAFAQRSGLWAVADDSGLEVKALGGEPGVHSKRYAGPNASDPDRILYLLKKLDGVPWKEREARFRSVIAIASPKGEVRLCQGEVHGIIAFEAKGKGGFGYDPIFYIPEMEKSMAELSLEEKNRVSHRGRAARKAVEELQRIFREGKLGIST